MRAPVQKKNQPRERESAISSRPEVPSSEPAQQPHPLLGLQQIIGNRAVQRMLRSHPEQLATGSTSVRRQTTPQAPGSTPEWFGTRTPGNRGLADDENANYSIRKGLVVEKQPKYSVVTISVGSKTADIAIRYAFPSSEITTGGAAYQWGESSTITTAKTAIKNALTQVTTDIQNYNFQGSQASSPEKIREDRLTAMFTQFSQQTPLNIFLSVNPMDQTPLTNSVTINAANATKDAATLIPTQMFSAARMAVNKPAGAATPQETQRTVLHETTHDMLIRSNADFVSVWNANNMALVPMPGGDLANLMLNVARAFVIAQEEDFTYSTEESLYPPTAAPGSSAPAPAALPQHAAYTRFISTVRSFFTKKGLKMRQIKLPVVPSNQSANVASWKIPYEFPEGAVRLTSSDESVMQLLMTSWSQVHGPAGGGAASGP